MEEPLPEALQGGDGARALQPEGGGGPGDRIRRHPLGLQAAEEGLEYPALRPLGRERCNMIAVVSGAVDGSLAVASTLSRDEHSAMKCFDYPGFFTPAAACCEGYCVLKVRAVVACECSTTTS